MIGEELEVGGKHGGDSSESRLDDFNLLKDTT
jgi:hypothetical protein